MLATECLRYPSDGNAPEYEIIKLDSSSVTAEHAHAILALLTNVYEKHFENPAEYRYPLPAGTVRAHYNPESDESVAGFLARMQEYTGKDAEYMYLSQVGGRPDLTDGGTMAGLIKYSPSQSRLSRMRRQQPNLFVNDVLVCPDLMRTSQRSGRSAGASLLHGAVAYGGYSPRRALALNAFEGDTTMDWFARLGLKRVRPAGELLVGEYELPQALLSTEGHVTLNGIQRILESRHPQLMFGRLMPLNTPPEPYEL